MRGDDKQQSGIFGYRTAEERVPQAHPLLAMRRMVDEALRGLSPRLARMYSKNGRPSIAPEKLLRALLLQVLYTIRSERQLMEQLDYNILYRWFVGLDMDDAVSDVTVFTKNRERLLKSEVADGFFEQVLKQARAQQLLSADHFTVDGTLIEAWAGQKSFQRKDGKTTTPEDGGSNPTVNFHGDERRDDTHRSTTDPEARLFKEIARKRVEVELHGACIDGESQRFGGGYAANEVDRPSRARVGLDDGLARGPRRAAHHAGWR